MALTEFFKPKKKTSITFSILAVSKTSFKVQDLFPRVLAWFDLSDYKTDTIFVVDMMIDPNETITPLEKRPEKISSFKRDFTMDFTCY